VDPIERIELATAFACTKVDGVTTTDLAKATPCSEFDVRGLLNHMIGGLGMLTTAASGGKAAIPDGDQFDSDPGASYRERREGLLAALRSPGALEHEWEMPFGAMAAQMMAGIAFMEHLTHGWDVAKATGQATDMPTELVTECMELVTPMDAMLRTPGVCGPAVVVPEDAPLQDRLVAFMGRTP
jgi:uncharacterized protein (TIGR03086 family)